MKKELETLAQEILAAGCLLIGNYQLSGGFYSPHYIELRPLRSFVDLREKIIGALLDLIKEKNLSFDCIADVPMGGTIWGAWLADRFRVPMLTPLADPKFGGSQMRLYGRVQQGQRALLVDDVATSGSAIERAVGVLKLHGVAVGDAVVIADREATAKRKLSEQNVTLHHLFTLKELLSFIPK